MICKWGHLYWADLRPGFGTEPGQFRPVVVIQTQNLNVHGHPSTLILPCTSQLTEENLLRSFMPAQCAGNEVDTDVLIDQCQAIDNRRIVKELGQVPPVIMKDIKRKLALLLDLDSGD